jgi:PPM family protein phosphatase
MLPAAMFPSPEQIPDIATVGAGRSDRGQKRELNEDRFVVRDDLSLYVVCDGAGGHNAGEVAAALAVRSITSHMVATVRAALETPEFDRFGIPYGARRISTAVHKANSDIISISRVSHQHRGMGTTAVAISLTPRSGLIHVANVGDSRCYRLRAGHLELLTQDHSLLTDVVESHPEMEESVLARLPRNLITRALGVEEELRVSVRSHAVVESDRYLLCSDGLHTVVEAPAILELLSKHHSRESAAQALLDAANHRGGPDNIAAVVVDCHGGPSHALPFGTTAPPPPPMEQIIPDPELLVLGYGNITVDGSASPALLQSLGRVFEKKK